ncbi:MAG TPA: hypothetical protein VEY95_08755 [Azospirillaceae bacterium]|nr:hypothetical protein [Azospirillaceae bacterium]
MARALVRPAAPRVRRKMQPRLLPVLIFVAVLMLGVRLKDVWTTVETGNAARAVKAQAVQNPPASSAAQVPAQNAATPTNTSQTMPAQQTAQATGPAQPAAQAQQVAQAQQAPAGSSAPVRSIQPAAASSDANSLVPDRFTDAEQEVLQRLAERRAEQNRRQIEQDQREALLVAAEKRIDQKLGEIKNLTTQLQALVKQADQLDRQETERLVKWYETMRPADAARIMGTLEMPVLLEVLSNMREAKAAPILAAMDAQRAREVTTQLAERRQIPPVPVQ